MRSSRPPLVAAKPNSSRTARPLVALATSSDWPDLPLDDRGIIGALARRDIDSQVAVWTDPSVDWSRFDLIVVRSCWDYHDDLQRWLTWVADVDRGARLCNPERILAWNARKTYLADLEAAGVRIVPTRFIATTDLQSFDSFERALNACPWEDWVIKPAVSAGALGTFQIARGELSRARPELAAALPELARRGPLLVQPFVPDIAIRGEQSLLFFAGRFSHAVVKMPATGDFRVQEKHGGTTTPVRVSPRLKATANGVLAAACRLTGVLDLAMLLYARVDFVASGDEHLLMELELTEPALFLDQTVHSETTVLPAERFAEVIAHRIAAPGCPPE